METEWRNRRKKKERRYKANEGPKRKGRQRFHLVPVTSVALPAGGNHLLHHHQTNMVPPQQQHSEGETNSQE